MDSVITYIEHCKELSLTARVSVALKVFESYCQEQSLHHPMITEFLDYLWKWPLIDDPDRFEPWESSKPFLVNFGFGLDPNSELEHLLSQANITERVFREIVSGIVDILWGSFWGASENELSLNALHKVILHASIKVLPNITPFKFSRFSENHGWGMKLTPDEVKYWRMCANDV